MLSFFGGEVEDFLHARCVRNVAYLFLIRPGANLFLDFQSHGLEVQSHFLQHVDSDALAELDEPQQQMLGAHKVVVETVRLFARQCQHLLGAWRKIAHSFVTHFLGKFWLFSPVLSSIPDANLCPNEPFFLAQPCH